MMQHMIFCLFFKSLFLLATKDAMQIKGQQTEMPVLCTALHCKAE